jgi:hypothetical protein
LLAALNYIDGTSATGFNTKLINVSNTAASIVHNTLNGSPDNGAYLGSSYAAALFNIISNCDTGIGLSISTNRSFSFFNDLYNNATDKDAGDWFAEAGELDVDPDFVDIANDDYEIQEASLQRNEEAETNQKLNYGASQAGGGGGGGGLPITAPSGIAR